MSLSKHVLTNYSKGEGCLDSSTSILYSERLRLKEANEQVSLAVLGSQHHGQRPWADAPAAGREKKNRQMLPPDQQPETYTNKAPHATRIWRWGGNPKASKSSDDLMNEKTQTHTDTHIQQPLPVKQQVSCANLTGAIEERLLSSFLNPNPTPLVHTSVIPDDEMSGSVQK